MKQWTKQEQPHQKHSANGNIREKDSANSRNGNLVFGGVLFLGDDNRVGRSTAAAVEVDSGALESTSIEAGPARGAEAEAVPASDRMTQYLGPPTDAATLALAEAGQLGQPTLVFFHAVCYRSVSGLIQRS
jgi:hypothetical protein